MPRVNELMTRSLILALLLPVVGSAQLAEPVSKSAAIWDVSRIKDRDECRIEFPDLIRFRGEWYCSFREGFVHGNDDSGRARLIRSADGKKWESVKLFEWDGGDIRDPRLSITPEGLLMMNSCIYYVGKNMGQPESAAEPNIRRQSVTWLSGDGENWSGVHACPTSVNTWLWDATWHAGLGYAVAYNGTQKSGALFRTRDGRSWRMLKDDFFPESGGTEAAIAFPKEDLGVCLLRQPSKGGVVNAKLGIGRGPAWQDWKWKALQIEWNGVATFAGPKLLVLSDGRLVATGRNMGLWFVNPETAEFTHFVPPIGNSYPGLVEHEGKLWVTGCSPKVDAVHFAAFNLLKKK
jgi:hypothetical protein